MHSVLELYNTQAMGHFEHKKKTLEDQRTGYIVIKSEYSKRAFRGLNQVLLLTRSEKKIWIELPADTGCSIQVLMH